MADKPLDFNKLKKKKPEKKVEEKPTVMYQEVKKIPVPEQKTSKASAPTKKEKAKRGRKSWKKAGVEYTRMAFDLPIETQQKLKQLLVTKFFGKYAAQDEMLNAALDDFIKKHMK